MISDKQLESLGFFHSHSIRRGEMPTFIQVQHTEKKPSVYMWLASVPNETENFEILYIGKAGFGIAQRLKEHAGGFRHSVTGIQNRGLIEQWYAEGRNEIVVYTRYAEIREILGSRISLYSMEEESLIKQYFPLWNRARSNHACDITIAAKNMPEKN